MERQSLSMHFSFHMAEMAKSLFKKCFFNGSCTHLQVIYYLQSSLCHCRWCHLPSGAPSHIMSSHEHCVTWKKKKIIFSVITNKPLPTVYPQEQKGMYVYILPGK